LRHASNKGEPQWLDGGDLPAPKDVEAFDRHYFEIHVPLAKKIPGLRKYEVSDGPIATPVGTPNVHRIGTLHFDDLTGDRKGVCKRGGQPLGRIADFLRLMTRAFKMFLFDNRKFEPIPFVRLGGRGGKMRAAAYTGRKDRKIRRRVLGDVSHQHG